MVVLITSLSLEDRVHELCKKALAAKDSAELNPILVELRALLHEHILEIRAMAAEQFGRIAIR